MKKNFHILCSGFAALAVFACTPEEKPGNPDEKPEEPEKIYTETFTDFESSDIPETIPFNGGVYTVKLTSRVETKSVESIIINTDIPWAWRVNYGSETGEAVRNEAPAEEFQVVIEGNYDIAEREVTVEISSDLEADEWVRIAAATQESALAEIGEDDVTFYYAKSNLTVKDGRWALEDHSYDQGMQFAHGDLHAVPAENYQGTAYSPEGATFALADLDDTGADPCTALSPKLRLPSYEELYNLYYMENMDDASPLEGVNGIRYRDTDFFMPYSGYLDKETGTFAGKNEYGAWWGLGADIDGCATVYAGNMEYTMLANDFEGKSLASVRCVRNIALPTYVSHSPAVLENSKETIVSVVTNPGDFKVYKVSIVSDYGLEKYADATDGKPTADIRIPENTDMETVTWTVFVNGISSGVSFVQPEMSDYALYVSHSPMDEQGPESFELKVKIDTDRESVNVEARSSKETVVSAIASKDAPEVVLTIPENTDSTPTTWTIYIDGENTYRTVVQAKAEIKGLSVEWSTGYLTVKDGAFTFAEPEEMGYPFKWMSKYGMNATHDSPVYSGLAYCPEETAIAKYADIPYGEDDPCASVAPAGTWRMPTVADFQELAACDFEITVKQKAVFTLPDGKKLIFVPSGQYNGTKFMLPDSSILVWTSEAPEATKANYLMLSVSKTDSTPNPTAKTAKTNGLMVRCVKDNK